MKKKHTYIKLLQCEIFHELFILINIVIITHSKWSNTHTHTQQVYSAQSSYISHIDHSHECALRCVSIIHECVLTIYPNQRLRSVYAIHHRKIKINAELISMKMTKNKWAKMNKSFAWMAYYAVCACSINTIEWINVVIFVFSSLTKRKRQK